jgi:hypothetical protein
MKTAPQNHPDEERLDDAERKNLFALAVTLGEYEAAKHLQVSRQTLGRAIAGLPLQRGTVLLLRENLGAEERGR